MLNNKEIRIFPDDKGWTATQVQPYLAVRVLWDEVCLTRYDGGFIGSPHPSPKLKDGSGNVLYDFTDMPDDTRIGRLKE